jgi:hypothetical protein
MSIFKQRKRSFSCFAFINQLKALHLYGFVALVGAACLYFVIFSLTNNK